jgi:hypothetical protein
MHPQMRCGDFDGKSYDNWLASKKEVDARAKDKLRYRYPGGEVSVHV